MKINLTNENKVMMKMNAIKYLLLGGFVCAGLASCSDDANEESFPVKSGDAVHFAAASPSTRTIYDDENIFQINWENSDAIKIYSNKPYEGVAAANYKVTPLETADPNNAGNKLYNEGTIAAAEGSQLMWADNAEHKFIGVYPADNAGVTVDAEKGTVTLPINHNQYCDVVTVAGDGYYSKKYSDYTYYAKPDMKKAYLVAYSALTPEQAAANNGNVFLNFKPVMTAIEVVVKGRDSNQGAVQLTGISIIRDMPDGTADTFTWDAQNARTTDMLPGNYTGTKQRTTTFVSLRTSDGTNQVTLANGQSIVITVFIPPYAVDANWPMSIRAHATGDTEVSTGNITNEILASNKRRVTLNEFPSNQTGNNWITPLDDNIYVSQLSIPGTHDAATGDGTNYDLGLGQTQALTLNEQFDMGIRCFDLRPCVRNSDIGINHGFVKTKYMWDQIMERFKYYLHTNPGEFIIILMRHEDEGDYKDTSWGPLMIEKLATMKNTINPSTGQSYTIDFRPDLTIGDCRGKILFLCRDWTKYSESGPTVGGYMGWSHSKDGGEVDIYGTDGSRGRINIQDCYAPSESGNWEGPVTGIPFNSNNKSLVQNFPAVKWNAIQILLNKSRNFHTDINLVNRWSINHSSGYVGGGIAGTYNSVSTTDGYRENAANNNVKLYNFIVSPGFIGSTGIVIMDFVGARTSGTYTVYGDLCPQAIINNNYKYVMKRKGE